MIGPHRNIIRCTISRGNNPNNKNKPYTGRSMFSCLCIFVVVWKKKIFVDGFGDIRLRSSCNEWHRRERETILTENVNFRHRVRAASRALSKCDNAPNAATDERKFNDKIVSTHRQWRDKSSCIRNNLPVGLPLRNRVLINVSRRDDALERPIVSFCAFSNFVEGIPCDFLAAKYCDRLRFYNSHSKSDNDTYLRFKNKYTPSTRHERIK